MPYNLYQLINFLYLQVDYFHMFFFLNKVLKKCHIIIFTILWSSTIIMHGIATKTNLLDYELDKYDKIKNNMRILVKTIPDEILHKYKKYRRSFKCLKCKK